MEEKLLWLGIYLKERNPLKVVRYFEEGLKAEEILEHKGYKKKELINLAKEELHRTEKQGIKILFRIEPHFPEKLKPIPYAPLFLYVKGVLERLSPSIAVIGSRKPTEYGKEVTRKFCTALAREKVIIVSGLARGIDGIAHKSTLEVEGVTIGVLGSGLDMVYPREHETLYQEIVKKNGAIVSEFPLGTRPKKENFPIRNRIISGLSDAILVVEAGKKSGTLITVKWALTQGKEVFAIPGNVFSSQSEGTHYLIKSGANVATGPEDLFEFFGIEKKEKNKDSRAIEKVSPEERRVLDALSTYPITLDELILKTALSPSELLSILTELELKNWVEFLPGNFVQLKT